MSYRELDGTGRSLRRSAAARRIGFGLLWVLAGVLVTAVTYTQTHGGTYIVAFGPVLYGLFRIGQGAWTLGRTQPDGKG